MSQPDPKNVKRILDALNELRRAAAAQILFIAPGTTGDAAALGIPEITLPGTGRQLPSPFLENVAEKMIDEVFRVVRARILAGGVSTNAETENAIFKFVEENLFGVNRALGDFTNLDFDEGSFSAVAAGIITNTELIAQKFPDTPLQDMQDGAFLRASLNEERITQSQFDALIEDVVTADRPDSQELMDILVDVRGNRQTNLQKASGLSGNDLRVSAQKLIEAETPQQLAAGESTFPLPEGPQDALRTLRQSELEDFFDPSKPINANALRDRLLADERVQALEGNFATGQELDETRKNALGLAFQQIATTLNGQINNLKDRGFTDDEIKVIMARNLDSFLDAGDLAGIVGEQEARISEFTAQQDEQERLEKLATPEGKKKAFNDLAFQIGFDTKSIPPEALAELQRRVPDTGIDQRYLSSLEGKIPQLQQQQRNIEFAGQKPEQRQAQIGGALGFETQARGLTFGAQRGGLTFGTAFDRDRQTAFEGSRANALARLDVQVQNALIEDPSLDISGFVEDLQGPGLTFNAQGFAQDVPERIAQIREQQPTITGLLPGQVPGSLSETQRFGPTPPTPPLAVGQPTIGGVPQGPRGGRLPPRFDLDRAGINQLVTEAAGDDPELRQLLFSRIDDPVFVNRFLTQSRQADIQEREEPNERVAHTFDSSTGKFMTTRTRRRSTPGTTSQNVFRLSTFARSNIKRLKAGFTPRRRFRGGGQARFDVFGRGRF